ncbi:hypothetical protein ElyMa_000796400 [Elysia marginata]|uniref:Uncharacterized protein n=1 Tax=Elysia marginata TaxID=1093978 RepID=A0AAV4GW54_9GAST|nr:hypothetical protein ElyMa_000796400 [Elysia marginata]
MVNGHRVWAEVSPPAQCTAADHWSRQESGGVWWYVAGLASEPHAWTNHNHAQLLTVVRRFFTNVLIHTPNTFTPRNPSTCPGFRLNLVTVPPPPIVYCEGEDLTTDISFCLASTAANNLLNELPASCTHASRRATAIHT